MKTFLQTRSKESRAQPQVAGIGSDQANKGRCLAEQTEVQMQLEING
jgi:hypothetical protein